MKKYSFALTALLLATAALFSVSQAAVQQSNDQLGKTMEGKVVSVDSTKGEIVIKDDKTGEKTLRIDASTKINKGGKAINLAEIGPGDSVRCEYEGTADNPSVKSITVTPTKADKS